MTQHLIGSVDNQSVVTITNDGEYQDPDEGFPRAQYKYVITTDEFEHVDDNVHGPSGEPADLNKAGQSIFAWLHDIGAAYLAQEDCGDNTPFEVAQWAAENQIDLGCESMRLERLASESPVPEDEDEPDEDGDEPF